MALKKALFWVAFCAVLAAQAQTRNVFVMPTGGSNQTNVYGADPFSLAATLQASPAAFLPLATLGGTKYYIVGRSPADAIVVTNSAFTVVQRINLLASPEAAALSPDGTRLLVVAGTALRIYSTATDTEVAAVELGGSVTDVAVSLDSSRAFVLSPALARLYAVDLATYAQVGVYPLPVYLSTGVSVAPNGLVYVTGESRIFEIDGRTMTLRTSGEIAVTGRPGKMAFTPDGNYGLAINQTAPLTGSLLFRLDLRTKTVGVLVGSGVLTTMTFTNLVVSSNGRAHMVSQAQKLYDIIIDPLWISESAPLGLSNTGVTAIGKSDEAPQARYLFVAALNMIYRIDLTITQVSGTQGPLGFTPGAIGFAGSGSGGPVASLLQFNNNQSVAVGGTSLPVIVRALDALGRPVYGAAVSVTTSVTGVTIIGASSITSADGYAQATVVLSSPAQTTIPVLATVGGAYANFVIYTGGATPGQTGGMQILAGNGQIIKQTVPFTSRPLTVAVKDLAGQAVPFATVTWSYSWGGTQSTTTDGYGQTAITLTVPTTPPAPPNQFSQYTVTATSYVGSVTFYITVLGTVQVCEGVPPVCFPRQIEFLPVLAAPTTGVIEGQSGQTLPGAIQMSVFTDRGVPIPYAGLEVSTNTDPVAAPTAACTSTNILTDANGFARCDMTFGRRTGEGILTVYIGGMVYPAQGLVFNVRPGVPAFFKVIQGSDQSGPPSQVLPQTLIAELSDAGGNTLMGVPVAWEFGTQGTGAVLRDATQSTDFNGRVSAIMVLGTRPGDLIVRVRAATVLEVFAQFIVRVSVNVGSLVKIAGDGQTALTGQAFGTALEVEVRDEQGRALPNTAVAFALSGGSATLSAAAVTSNAAGRATVDVTAGATGGTITITATAGNSAVTFTLTSRLPGPTLTAASFVNGASYRPGLVPGAVTAIVGAGLASAIQGCVGPGTVVGPLPMSVAGVEITFGFSRAPIYAVCNVSGQEQVIFQAPFDMAPGYTTTVFVKVGAGTTVVERVPVVAAMPGIFETTAADGRRYAVAVNPDGSLVSTANPAKRGAIVRIYATGLGVVLPLSATNLPGFPGQRVWLPVIAGLAGRGVRLVSAEYAANMIGVYEVTIEIPSDLMGGTEVTLALGVVTAEGQPPVYAADSKIAIQ